MTPNPYTVLGVGPDEMDKLQVNVSLVDKKFVDSLIPDRGFKTWAIASFFRSLVQDIHNADIDSYSETNEQQIREFVRQRTIEFTPRQVSQSDDSRGSSRVRKTSTTGKKVSARSESATRQRTARGTKKTNKAAEVHGSTKET